MLVRVQVEFTDGDGITCRHGDLLDVDETHPWWQAAFDDGLVKPVTEGDPA